MKSSKIGNNLDANRLSRNHFLIRKRNLDSSYFGNNWDFHRDALLFFPEKEKTGKFKRDEKHRCAHRCNGGRIFRFKNHRESGKSSAFISGRKPVCVFLEQ